MATVRSGANMFWILLTLCCIWADQSLGLPEEQLVQDLMSRYNSYVRPALNESHTVHVRHGFSLIQLDVKNEIEGKNILLETAVWLTTRWTDIRLQWDPSDYNGIRAVTLPPSEIWVPDIVLYNDLGMLDERLQGYRARITNDGEINWIPMTRLTVACPAVEDWYQCSWKFGSWVHNGFEVDLYTDGTEIDLANYVVNPEWELLNTSSTRNVVYYSCCPEPYTDVVYKLNIRKRESVKKEPIRRKSGLFSYVTRGEGEVHESDMTRVLLLPTVIVSLLVPFQFLVPPESCQRISVLTILLVALVGMFFVMHGADQELLESTIDLDHFYYVSIVWVFAALLLSILTLHICRWGHNRSRLPDCLRKVFLRCLSKVVCISYSTGYDVSSATVSKDLVDEKHDVERGSRLEEQMAALLNVVRGLSNYVMELKDNHSEWYLMVLVLDRLLCLIFLIIFIVYACIVLV